MYITVRHGINKRVATLT